MTSALLDDLRRLTPIDPRHLPVAIDMRHPLAVLAMRMLWGQIEATLAPVLAHTDRNGRLVQDADLFGSKRSSLAPARVSRAGSQNSRSSRVDPT